MGMQGKRVNFTRKTITQRGVDELVLLHHGTPRKLLADHDRLEMISLTLHYHFCARDAGPNQCFKFTALHEKL